MDVQEFRAAARAWLAANMPRVDPDNPPNYQIDDTAVWQRSRELQRRIHDGGFAGICFPAEYGGLGLTREYQRSFDDESAGYELPYPLNVPSLAICCATLLDVGSEAQKREHISAALRGEEILCQLLSEPGAGSDLASVKTRAVPNGKGFVLNGQKIWTTNAHHCHYMIALVRTSGEAGDRHKGLSQVIVDLSLPGVTVRPITDLSGDSHFCEVFFDNVQLPPDALIGQEGQGWEQVTAELAFERSGPERLFSSIVLFDEWLAWLRATGERSEGALRLAGRVFTELAPLRAMSVAVQDKLVRGESPIVEAALVKELGTTLEQSIPAAIADDLFAREASEVPLELLRTLNYVTEVAPSYSLRGGTRDILRGMIARGLGLR